MLPYFPLSMRVQWGLENDDVTNKKASGGAVSICATGQPAYTSNAQAGKLFARGER